MASSSTAEAADNGAATSAPSTIVQFARQFNLSANYDKYFDDNLVTESIDPNVSTNIHLNTYVLVKAAGYKNDPNAIDEHLFWDFQSDFEDWDATWWTQVKEEVRKILKDTLRKRGVYTGPYKGKIVTQLPALVQAEEFPEWPQDEYVRQTQIGFDDAYAAYRARATNPSNSHVPSRPASPRPPTSQGQQQAQQGTAPGLVVTPPTATVTTATGPAGTTVSTTPAPAAATPAPVPAAQTPSPATGSNAVPLGIKTSPSTAPPSTPSITDPDDDVREFPPKPVPNLDLDPKKLESFSKLWDRDFSFTGEAYSILDDTVNQLYQLCDDLDLVPGQYHKVITVTLKGRAKSWFSRLNKGSMTFAVMYTRLQEKFGTHVHQQRYLADWTTTTYLSVKMEEANVNKPADEITQITLDRLHLCQRALGPGYAGESVLCDTVNRAFTGVEAFRMTLHQPPKTFEELSASLFSSLAAFHATQVVPQINYVDRQFRTNKDTAAAPKAENSTWKRRCWVCGKEKCFSTNHPEKDQKEAHEKWKAGKFKGNKPTKAAYMVFLCNWEGVKEDDDVEEQPGVSHLLGDIDDFEADFECPDGPGEMACGFFMDVDDEALAGL